MGTAITTLLKFSPVTWPQEASTVYKLLRTQLEEVMKAGCEKPAIYMCGLELYRFWMNRS
jgi:hypothetical protein